METKLSPEKMSRDIRNIIRGRCQSCSSCSGFISVSGRVRCDYCGCPPAQHQQLEDQQQQPEDKEQQQEEQHLAREKTILKRSSSSSASASANDDSDLRVSSSDDLRSCISEGEMGEDSTCVGVGVGSGGRVSGFRSNPDLLHDGVDSRRSKG